jgi:hypothetical protein
MLNVEEVAVVVVVDGDSNYSPDRPNENSARRISKVLTSNHACQSRYNRLALEDNLKSYHFPIVPGILSNGWEQERPKDGKQNIPGRRVSW